VAADVFGTHRRYLFAKSLKARLNNDLICETWDAIRKGMTGTPIAATFPAASALEASGYWAMEDLQGATVAELQSAGLNAADAQAVYAQLEHPS